jgi:hypothetical protein
LVQRERNETFIVNEDLLEKMKSLLGSSVLIKDIVNTALKNTLHVTKKERWNKKRCLKVKPMDIVKFKT